MQKTDCKQLYEQIISLMEDQKPYTDADFSLEKLAEMLCTSRTPISNAINTMAGMNFRSWLAKYRIEAIKTFMAENPKATMASILAISGYSNRTTLYRHFRNVVGDTPSSFLKDDK